tara:strand:- start:102 stop:506 length:405 start_codon:yes stop_codon:yes gene_type:complete
MANSNIEKNHTLSPQRELFLEYLFNDPDCNGDVKKAAVAAGYQVSGALNLARELKDEIKLRTEEAIVFLAPKAVQELGELVEEDGKRPKADIRMKAVSDVLDRVGVAKKQDIGISIMPDSPMFFIPAKIGEPED